jgi:osmotically-inducible protein OsmY
MACVLAGVAVALAPAAFARQPDAWITAKTKIALMGTEGLDALDVNVDTVDGRVTLQGKVASPAAKAEAEREARKVAGVVEVRNLLQVVPESRKEAVKSSDEEIAERAKKALRDESSLADSDVKVQSVNDGVVVLAGEARSVSDHLRAMEVVRRVPGVRRVASEVKSPDRIADEEIRQSSGESAEAGVKRGIGGTASDAWITAATKLRLLADDRTPALDVNVDTRDGVVTLFGVVPSAEAKAAAEAEARKVDGVRQVRNELEVVASAKREAVEAKDDEVEAAVERTLEGRDDLHAAKISVEVKNGVARLTGTVPGEQERLAAAVAARSTAGVRAVRDDLRVSPVR